MDQSNSFGSKNIYSLNGINPDTDSDVVSITVVWTILYDFYGID